MIAKIDSIARTECIKCSYGIGAELSVLYVYSHIILGGWDYQDT